MTHEHSENKQLLVSDYVTIYVSPNVFGVFYGLAHYSTGACLDEKVLELIRFIIVDSVGLTFLPVS